jgi:hypothetical protein
MNFPRKSGHRVKPQAEKFRIPAALHNQARVTSFSVVEDFNVVKQAADCFGAAGVPVMIHPFGFKKVEEAFRNRVIVTVSFAAHAASHAMLGKQFLVITEAYWLP